MPNSLSVKGFDYFKQIYCNQLHFKLIRLAKKALSLSICVKFRCLFALTLVGSVLWQMYAELQVLSPLVPTREAHFFRYCQQNAEEGTWVIVDFPADSFHDSIQPTLSSYRRRPSGCVIQDMPNGYSKVRLLTLSKVFVYFQFTFFSIWGYCRKLKLFAYVHAKVHDNSTAF